MPQFSAFQDFVAFRFSAKPTHGESIYRSMISSVSKAFDTTKGTYEEARIYGQAMGLARARYMVERAFNQFFPRTVTDLLPKVEYDWSLIPGPYDGIVDRQDALAAAEKLPRGSRRENVESILRDIYGSDFIAYRTIVPAEVVSWPPDPWSGPGVFKREDKSVLPKYFKLLYPVVFPDGPGAAEPTKVYYTTFDAEDPAILEEGEQVTVQVENLSLAEQITVVESGKDEDGLFFTAFFTKSHDIGASIVSATVPVWMSNQRVDFIVVKSPASRDLAKWRRTNDILSKVLRGVSTWYVVEPSPTDATKIGPYTLNVSLIGLTPIGEMDIVVNPSGVPSVQPPDPEFLIPRSGDTAGGDTVRIFGNGFTGASAVTFDGNAATIVSVVDKEIVCTTPAHATAWVDIVVTTPAGSTTLVEGFRYE